MKRLMLSTFEAASVACKLSTLYALLTYLLNLCILDFGWQTLGIKVGLWSHIRGIIWGRGLEGFLDPEDSAVKNFVQHRLRAQNATSYFVLYAYSVLCKLLLDFITILPNVWQVLFLFHSTKIEERTR